MRRCRITCLVFCLASSVGCSDSTGGAVHSVEFDRSEFARRIAKVAIGDTEQRVIDMLGTPDEIWSQDELTRRGVQSDQIAKSLCYGIERHLGFPTLGRVYLDRRGTVVATCGGEGTPPKPDIIPENEIRRLVDLLDEAPTPSGRTYNPAALIRIANELHGFGKDRVLLAMREYSRVACVIFDHGQEKLGLVLRVLFDVPSSGAFPDLQAGRPLPYVRTDLKLIPRFPIALADDIPILLVSGYEMSGRPYSVESDLDFWATNCQLRPHKLRPCDSPLDVVGKIVDLAKRVNEREKGAIDAEVWRLLAIRQILAAAGTQYNVSSRFPFSREGDRQVETAYKKAVEASKTKHLKWDDRANEFLAR